MAARGWYIDDIRVYSCPADSERPTGDLSIDDGAARTGDPAVRLTISARDASSSVTHLRVAGSRRLNDQGLLADGLTMPFREGLAWDLADRTYGGDGKPGQRAVFGQVRDAAGRWSAVFSDAIDWQPG